MSTQDSQHSAQSGQDTGTKSIKDKAAERLGQWLSNKYRIEQLLGVGGMAAVYSATTNEGVQLALKVLHTEFARDEGVKVRFLREGYVANKVQHPGIVAISEDGETELGESFLVMELLEGDTLQGVWKKYNRKVPPTEAMRIAEAVLDVLGLFHGIKIIHRDIKPANIFITQDGRVKLLDFGVAQDRGTPGEALTRAGTALGTPSYMSPEQAMGKSDSLDGRSDVFAIGATLYAIMSGKRLHHGKSDNEAFILAATQPAPSIARAAPDLPIDVIALVDKSLQWDRRNRFQTAHDMRDECRRVIELLGGPGPVYQPSGATAAAPQGAAAVLSEVAMPSVPTPTHRPPPPPPPPPPVPSTPPPGASRSGRAQPSYGPDPSNVSGLRLPASVQQSLEPTPTPRPAPGAAPVQLRGDPGAGLREAPGAQLRKGRAGQIDLGAPIAPSTRPAADEVDRPALAKDVFERIERALPTFRQYTLDHPESKNRLRGIHKAISDALNADPESMQFVVNPFCFTQRMTGAGSGSARDVLGLSKEIAVWEPSSPNDAVPYNLCSAGVEEMRIERGVTEEEVYLLLRALLLDVTIDAQNSDVKAAIWEARFEHIRCSVREDVSAQDPEEEARFSNEVAHLEQMARDDLAELAAMTVTTDKKGFDAAQAASQALGLDTLERVALGAKLVADATEWRKRFLQIAAEGYGDGESRGDSATLLVPLAQYAFGFISKDRYGEVFTTYFALLDGVQRLAQMTPAERMRGPAMPRELGIVTLTRGLFPPDTMRQLLRVLTNEGLPAEQREALFTGMRTVLGSLDAGWFDDAISTANQLPDGEALELVMAYAERHVGGRESQIISRLDTMRPAMAQRCLALVTATRSPQAIALLKPLLNSGNHALRCEALALLTPSDDQLGKQLLAWLETSDQKLRMAALTTMAHHNVRVAGPGLVRQIEALEKFMEKPPDEQRQMFDTLYSLHPSRAEQVLVKIVERHGLMADAQLDRTRMLAAETLGKRADNAGPIGTLEDAAKRRPWNSPDLRAAAGKAVEQIGARLGRAQAAPGRDS